MPLIAGLLLPLLVAVGSSSRAQSHQRSIDSLLSALRTEPRDTARVMMFIELGEFSHASDDPKGGAFLDSAMRLAEKRGFIKGMAAAQFALGQHALMQNPVRSLSHFHAALRLAKEQGDARLTARALSRIGEIHAGQANPDSALLFTRQAITFAEENHLQEVLATSLFVHGKILYRLGRLAEAQEQVSSSIQIHRMRGDQAGETVVTLMLGTLKKAQGKFEEALQCYRICEAYYLKTNNPAGSAQTHHMMADLFKAIGRGDEAISYYTRCLALAESHRLRTLQASALLNISNVYDSRGEYETALKLLLTCLAVAEDLGDRRTVSTALSGIGGIHNDQRRYDQARQYFSRSLEVARSMSEPVQMSMALRGIALAYANQGKADEALEYFNQALRMSEQSGARSQVAMTSRLLGDAQWQFGRHEQAKEAYAQCLRVSREIGDSAEAAHSHVGLGRILHAEGYFADAAFHFAQAISTARAVGALPVLQNALSNSSVLAAARNDFAAAYRYRLEYDAVKDSLLNEANVRTIGEMTAKYESERREQQIALLEKDKKLQSLDLERSRQALEMQTIESERNRQRAALLAREREILGLELLQSASALHLRTKEAEMQRAEKENKQREVTLLTRERSLQATVASRERTLRNVLLAGIVLLIAVGVLFIRRIQDRRREAALRAEAAEYKAGAAQADIERKEREAHEEYTRRLIASQEQERRRVALELHDGVGQGLLLLQNLALRMIEQERLDDGARATCGRMSSLLSTTLQDMRHVSLALHPYHLDHIGITATLKAMIRNLAENTRIEIIGSIDNIDALLSKEDEIGVYRIVQECFNNILKHAQATRAEIAVRRAGASVRISVSDDGIGLKRNGNGRQESERGGLGLTGMRERVSMLGGSVRITSAPGAGTTVDIVIPVPAGQVREEMPTAA